MRGVHKIGDILRLGLHGIVVHKVRSALTALGILFGVWSVIAMLAINAGLSYESQLALRELGSTNIIVDSVKPTEEESKASQSGALLEYGLTVKDVARLKTNIPQVQRCAVVHRTLKMARVRGRRVQVSVLSTEPNYVQVARTELLVGRFISSADVLRRQAHCVLTASLARRLFLYEDPLGKVVVLGAQPFVVVGILRRLPSTLAGQAGAGGSVIIPLPTDRSRFGKLTALQTRGSFTLEKVEVSQVILQMGDEDAVLEGAKIARSILTRFRDKDDYEVKVPIEEIELMKKDRQRWNFMFFMIASVSLLVGGIGIMNIMLASVTERTREIGIRRALGAKRRDIITQFLVESIALTTVGGLLGIVLGIAVPWAVEKILKFTTIVSAATLILPLAMAVAVGLVSGIYPALRAARLDPIEALRHE